MRRATPQTPMWPRAASRLLAATAAAACTALLMICVSQTADIQYREALAAQTLALDSRPQTTAVPASSDAAVSSPTGA